MSNLTPEATDNNFALPRRIWQSGDLQMSLFKPIAVEFGKLYLPDAIQGLPDTIADNWYIDHVIAYDTIPGYGSVEKNQTIYFYAPDGRPIGKSRIRYKDGNDIYYQISEQIPLTSGCSYIIGDYHELWPVFPRAVVDGDNNVTYYKDYDIPYTDQNLYIPPVPILGPNFAGFVNTDTRTRDVFLCATGSYAVDGSTITDYFWTFPPDVVPTATTGGYLTATFPVGSWTVKTDVVTSNGTTGTGYRHFILNSTPTMDTSGFFSEVEGVNFTYNYPPIYDWTLDNLAGDWDSGNWICKVTVGERADEFYDGALVIIWSSDNVYGNTEAYTGAGYENSVYTHTETYLGNWPTRDHVLFVGYVVRVDNKNSGDDSRHTITLKSVSGLLDNKDMFSVSLETTNAPTDWTQLANMTINKIINHYLRWHSTLLEVGDFYEIQSAPGDYYEQYEDIPRGQIFSNIRSILDGRVFGNIATNKQGQTYTEVNVNLLQTGTRPSTLMTFNNHDWLDIMSSTEIYETPVTSILLGGVGYDIGIASGTAYLSKAPDAQFPASNGKPETKSGLNVTSQDECNRMAGLYFGWRNNDLTNISMEMANNFQFVDIVPQELFKLDTTYPFSEVDQRDLVTKWQDRRMIPRKVTISRVNDEITEAVTFESETNGKPGEKIVIPVVSKNDPPSSPPPPGGNPPGGERVWVVTQSKVGFTSNWSTSSPHYLNKSRIGGWLGGTITDFVLDPHNSIQRGITITENEVWLSNNLASTYPNWGYVLTASEVEADTGKTGVEFAKVCYSITQPGLIYTAWVCDGGGTSSNTLDYDCSPTFFGATTPASWPVGACGWLFFEQAHGSAVEFQEVSITYSGSGGNQYNQIIVSVYDGSWQQIGVYAITPPGVGTETTVVTLSDSGATVADRTGTQINIRPAYDGVYTFISGQIDDITVTVDDGTPGSGSGIGVSVSQNFGGTWDNNVVVSNTGLTKDRNLIRRIKASHINSGQVYLFLRYSGSNGKLYKSSNYAAGWSNIYTVGGSYNGLDWDMAYLDGDATQVIIAADGKTYVSTDYGASFTLKRTLSNVSQLSNYYTINIATLDPTNFIAFFATSPIVEKSTDGGDNYSDISSSDFSGLQALGRWPSNIARWYWLSTSDIWYSIDDGVTHLNKNGDWATVMGGAFANPVQVVPSWME